MQIFRAFSLTLLTFEEWFLLPNSYKIMSWNFEDYHSYLIIITNWQILIKFWDGSCSNLKGFAPFGRNDRGGSCSEKNAIPSQLHNGKKGCTMIQGQNQFKFSGGNNGKNISSTFFLFHQNIKVLTELLIDMDSSLLWYFNAKIGVISTS